MLAVFYNSHNRMGDEMNEKQIKNYHIFADMILAWQSIGLSREVIHERLDNLLKSFEENEI